MNLQNNIITTINLYGVEALAVGQTTGLINPQRSKRNVRVLLEGNPLDCDCRAYDMIRYFQNKLDSEVYGFVTLVPGNLTCNTPDLLKGVQVTRIDPYHLVCDLDSDHNCPKSCDCKVRIANWGLVVNCTEKGLVEVPRELPIVAYTNHTELYLTGNDIRTLPNATYRGYENISRLYLSNNQITSIDTGFLSPKIQELAVDYNNLTKFSPNLVRFLTQSTQIRLLKLNNNPWLCECSAKAFLELVQLKFKQVNIM